MADLQTEFTRYTETLRDNNLTEDDTQTLVAKDLPTVRAGAPGQVDDANTMYLVYIP